MTKNERNIRLLSQFEARSKKSLDVMVQGLNFVLFCKFFFCNNFAFMEEL